MSLNPFELRFKLLEMSQKYFQEQATKNQELAAQVWETAVKQGEETVDFYQSLLPASYSIEDIKNKAEELYEFVDKK
tara:strand:- start:100 stop:330 length:231 start_codon:yes stop_codon:yes gene_type:complete